MPTRHGWNKFDLLKDIIPINKYKGKPPYASEHYGVYQPLLGWESKLTQKWIQRGGMRIDPRVKLILDGRLSPGPKDVTVVEAAPSASYPLHPLLTNQHSRRCWRRT